MNEDQLNELEALKSIYPSELTIENETSPVRLSIHLGIGEKSEASGTYDDDGEDDDEDEGGGGEDDRPYCVLSFELPSAYPEVTPEIELTADESGLDESAVKTVLDKLNELAVENVGLPMVYTIASAAQEELNHLGERIAELRSEVENRKKAEEDERERHRLEGTRVTVENFLAWKARFDDEMGRTKKLAAEAAAASRRATGREQFLRDASLSTSDIRLIEESGEELKIDETLYGEDEDLGEVGELSEDEEDEK